VLKLARFDHVKETGLVLSSTLDYELENRMG
jgi:hypothetical protein